MDGKLMDYLEVKKLEKLPTKKELIATIARLINQVRSAGMHARLHACCFGRHAWVQRW